jgi:microsomal dipeptidase-like Zn-dependent dipeptidase
MDLMGILSLILAILLGSEAVASPRPVWVDLHSHLFMKEGLGWGFRGSFDDKALRASSWKDRFSNSVNEEELNQSGLALAVEALYVHPATTTSLKDSIRAQIAHARTFVARNPAWILACSAADAREAVKAGKRVLVLSLEGASGILDDDADLDEFIDRGCIRIVTLLHMTDDRYGGAALMGSYNRLGNPLEVLRQLFGANRDDSGIRVNTRGLSEEGERLVRKLMERNVWIDLSHASDASAQRLKQLMTVAGQPFLMTHTTLREFRGSERAVSEAQLLEVAQSGGVVGLGACEDPLAHTVVAREFCPKGCSLEACSGGVHALATQYAHMARVIGNESLMLGYDFNGAERHLRPACKTGTSLDQKPGLWRIGQNPDVWQALKVLGAPIPVREDAALQKFIEVWGRVTDR